MSALVELSRHGPVAVIALRREAKLNALSTALEGLEQVYGLTNAEFEPVTLGAQYTALDEGDIDAANVFTTDPQLEGGDYTVLEDPESLFGSQNAVMVVDSDKLESVGKEQFLRVVDTVNELLTTDVIVGLNSR